MRALPLAKRQGDYLQTHGIRTIFDKQLRIFLNNPRHPSLHTELLEPKHLHLYSFRITRSHRAIFIYTGDHTIEIIDINNHYR